MICTITRLLTYFYLMSTVVVLCDYNENIFVCSYVVCAVQIHCHVVYIGSSMMFQCFEVKPEDDKPSAGVFASSGEQEFLVLFLSVHSMQSVILFQQFCPSVCPHVTSSDVKFHDFFLP